jgi:hypothetical protein
MNKEFVTYKQALALKELEFDEPCLARHIIMTEWEKPTGQIILQMVDCLNSDKYLVKAPLYQQAFKFFRKKHNMRVWVEWGSEYLCCAMIQHSSGMKECIDCCSNNEEAEQACLDKLIEICKNKQA